MLALHKVIEET